MKQWNKCGRLLEDIQAGGSGKLLTKEGETVRVFSKVAAKAGDHVAANWERRRGRWQVELIRIGDENDGQSVETV